ncbi:hypothetical protein GQ53DRAFT_406233 [Thozetella sp. PMI_491]|nr:hypothetical protein GQ53DRAFT_406233 [Thozetella sp. PMI_491]
MDATDDVIPTFREASRRLVREWGFLRPRLPCSVLSASATHCLIEVGDFHVNTFERLRRVLCVSDDELQVTLAELAANGDIATVLPDPGDEAEAGEAVYRITPNGTVTLAAINAFAQNQVETALATISPGASTAILTAFRQYAAALRQARAGSALTPEATPLPSPRASSPVRETSSLLLPTAAPSPPPSERQVTIVSGYRPGILGRTLEMHLDFYSGAVGWGAKFEEYLSSKLSGLMTRLSNPLNEAWCAIETTAEGRERIIGTIYIDGESLGEEGVAHLRAYVMDDAARGLGLGRKLFDSAMQFVRDSGFRECRLWTMRSLVVARRLYEGAGFKLVNEFYTEEMGNGIWSMEYHWRREENQADSPCLEDGNGSVAAPASA